MSFFSEEAFQWVLVFIVASIGLAWPIVDVTRMRSYFKRPKAEQGHDELFGMWIGILLGLSGLAGLVKHFAGW